MAHIDPKRVEWTPQEQTDVTFRGADGVFYHIPKAALAQYAVPEAETTGYAFGLGGPVKLGPGAGSSLPFRPPRRVFSSDACSETSDTGAMGCPG